MAILRTWRTWLMRCRSETRVGTGRDLWYGAPWARQAFCACLALWLTGSAASAQDIPRPKYYVTDRAKVMDSQTRRRINGYLQELEQKTTAQVLVLTVPTTDGKSIEQFSLSLAEKWKLGQKGKDNGVLIVVAVRDRDYRIEVGYGLEGLLPDSWVGTVGRSAFEPNFKAGNYSKGIEQAALAVAARVAEHYNATISGMPAVRTAMK